MLRGKKLHSAAVNRKNLLFQEKEVLNDMVERQGQFALIVYDAAALRLMMFRRYTPK